MGPGETFVAVVFLIVLGWMVTSKSKTRHARKHDKDDANREAEALRDHIAELEDRIRVLERIITDSRGSSREDLRQQFRELET